MVKKCEKGQRYSFSKIKKMLLTLGVVISAATAVIFLSETCSVQARDFGGSSGNSENDLIVFAAKTISEETDKNIILMGNLTINLTSVPHIVSGENALLINRDIEMDLNGYTLSISVDNGVDANGIKIANGMVLTVKDSTDSGSLYVNNSFGNTLVFNQGRGAAINVSTGSTLNVESGKITALSGSSGNTSKGAGIGGGYQESGGIINIYGTADVTAKACYGAGIGGGYNRVGIGGTGGTVTISDQAVVTVEGRNAAGIGGGSSASGHTGGSGGDVIINGGKVVVNIPSGGGAGIGGGRSEYFTGNGANGGDGGTVKISGGEVNITVAAGGAGIGGGSSNATINGTGGVGASVEISGGSVTVINTGNGAGIGGGSATGNAGTGGDGGMVTISGGIVKVNSSGSAGIGGGGNNAVPGAGGGPGIITGGSMQRNENGLNDMPFNVYPVRIKVTDILSTPLPNVKIETGLYVAYTDINGEAIIWLSAALHDIEFWLAGYDRQIETDYSVSSTLANTLTVSLTVDSQPPSVYSVSYDNATGATDVPVDGNIIVVFDEPMNTSIPGNISVDGVPLVGPGSWSADAKTYTIPYGTYAYSQSFTLVINGFTDMVGSAMSLYSSSFVTVNAPPAPGGGTLPGGGTAPGSGAQNGSSTNPPAVEFPMLTARPGDTVSPMITEIFTGDQKSAVFQWYINDEPVSDATEENFTVPLTSLMGDVVSVEVRDGNHWGRADILIIETHPIAAFVIRLYNGVFMRTPEAEGFSFWVYGLANQEITAIQTAHFFFLSPEMHNLNLSDVEYINRLYTVLMNREPDTDGRIYWLNALEKGINREGLLRQFLLSREFRGICQEAGLELGSIPNTAESRNISLRLTIFLYEMYEELTESVISIEDLNYWTSQYLFEGKHIADIANEMISEKILSGKWLDEEFIQILYRIFLEREADPDGNEYWVRSLKEGSSRSAIINHFAYSVEFIKIKELY